MVTIENYNEDFPSKHWDQRKLNVKIYKDVFDDRFFNTLKRSVINQLNQNTLTYSTHRTTFTFEGETKKIVKHNQNARNQQVVYDLTFVEQWWHQTTYTIKEWSDNYLRTNINPVFYKYLKHFENLPPFADEPGCWIPFRWHINVLDYSKFLTIHTDMNDQYFNTKGREDARARSLTFYFQDHVEGYGGEFWTDTGFIYKPKHNTALAINGNECLHGVNANMNPDRKPRLAFTTRWAHKDDFYLPGHPSKAMYKLEW